MDFLTVVIRAREIGLSIDQDTSTSMIMRAADEVSGSMFTVSAVQVGSDIGLLRDERTAIGDRRMRHIDACDELNKERQKRLKRESEARRRARKGAMPRNEAAAKQRPWEAMGCSRATYYRQRQMRQIRGPVSLKEERQRHETVSLPGERHETVSYGRVKYGSLS
ncbi:MAG: hypothetical protein RIB57_13675 [Pelagibacterium sp.]|uniref:hypothetical protein n=1 Tax=Pelagibacterium sp. TaxID=1967288 RepID=UPI0032EC9D1F